MPMMNVIEFFINILANSRVEDHPHLLPRPLQRTEVRGHGLYKTTLPLKYHEIPHPRPTSSRGSETVLAEYESFEKITKIMVKYEEANPRISLTVKY